MSTRKTLTALVALSLALAGTAQADTLWGVTNGINDSGFWTGGEIFTVDSVTGQASVLYSYNNIQGFGDIAVSDGGDVYVTYAVNYTFDKLAKVNMADGSFDWVVDLGGSNDQVNALEFVNGTLYGITGGGIASNLIQFTLNGASTTGANLGSVGVMGINSDGDLVLDPVSGDILATFWDGRPQTGATFLDSIALGTPPVTTGGPNLSTGSNYVGVAGLAFDSNGTLFAGSYYDQQLYTVNPITGAATASWDISSTISGGITGLSVPEPTTLGLLALGGLALLRRCNA